jgi:hypothetical protein
MVERPGWIRMSIHPTITNAEVLFVCESIKQTVKNVTNCYMYPF